MIESLHDPLKDPLLTRTPEPSPGISSVWIPWDEGLRTVPMHEVARVYGIGQSTLRRYVSQGRIRTVRIGKHQHVTLQMLRAFLANLPNREALRPPSINACMEGEKPGRADD